jgi:hypothetical protein
MKPKTGPEEIKYFIVNGKKRLGCFSTELKIL